MSQAAQFVDAQSTEFVVQKHLNDLELVRTDDLSPGAGTNCLYRGQFSSLATRLQSLPCLYLCLLLLFYRGLDSTF